jgi:hypothetical protein
MLEKKNKNLKISYIQINLDDEEIEKRLDNAFGVLFNEIIEFEKLKSVIRFPKISSIFSRYWVTINNL